MRMMRWFVSTPLFMIVLLMTLYPATAEGYRGLRAGDCLTRECFRNLIVLQGTLEIDSPPIATGSQPEFSEIARGLPMNACTCPLAEADPVGVLPYRFVKGTFGSWMVFCPYHLCANTDVLPASIASQPIPPELVMGVVDKRVERNLRRLFGTLAIFGLCFLVFDILMATQAGNWGKGLFMALVRNLGAGIGASFLALAGWEILMSIPPRDVLFTGTFHTVAGLAGGYIGLYLFIWFELDRRTRIK